VVLEAMASARPVVASDVAAIGSAIKHGTTGLLVPPNDPAALAHALQDLARRPAWIERIGCNARARVEAEFELGRCTDRLGQLLRSAYA